MEDARDVCVLFVQEEAFLASVPGLTFIFYVRGEGLPRGYLQGEKKSNFNLMQFTYHSNFIYI